MHSVSYGQGVMKYKSNCLGVGASHTITKEKIYIENMLKIRLPHIQNAMEILISVIKRVVYKILVWVARGRNNGCIISLK